MSNEEKTQDKINWGSCLKFTVSAGVFVVFLWFFLGGIDRHLTTLLTPQKEIMIKEVTQMGAFSDSVKQGYNVVSCVFNTDTSYCVDSMRREMLLNITPMISVTPQVSVIANTDTPTCTHKDFKEAYDLFDKHFNILLVIMGFLVTVFGLLVPIASYLFQRMSLKEEREALDKKIKDTIKKMNKKVEKTKEEFNLLKFKTISQIANSHFSSYATTSSSKHEIFQLFLGLNVLISGIKAPFIQGMFTQFLRFLIGLVEKEKSFCGSKKDCNRLVTEVKYEIEKLSQTEMVEELKAAIEQYFEETEDIPDIANGNNNNVNNEGGGQ